MGSLPMEIIYTQIEGKEVKEEAGLQELYRMIFNENREGRIVPPTMNKLYVWLAKEGDTTVGFKIGYELKSGKYYSWLGGVHPDYRGNGIAGRLMEIQHDWCKANGYKTVQTKTKNFWRNMLILNIKSGFDIIGTYTDSFGEPKIILEKKL
jgi:GNAT superfamily N-acetyltransferase